MRLLLAVLLGCSLLLLASCGKEREPAPRLFDVEAPKGQTRESFAGAGMEFERPSNWRIRSREAPGVFELTSGEVAIAGWAYDREEELPEPGEQLEAARRRLLEAIEERDPEFRVRSAETTEVGGAPAIDVLGDQVIAGRRLRTRSVHVFEGRVEYVIEALAPPADHALVDRRVLEPLLRSLELRGVIREDEE